LINAFEAVTGCSPMAYVRAHRLAGVRDTLINADRTGARIIDIAADWGFWHMGHFAAAYRAMFGEAPSDTIAGGNRKAIRGDMQFSGVSAPGVLLDLQVERLCRSAKPSVPRA
jgi:AraC-like DNA-binding protein